MPIADAEIATTVCPAGARWRRLLLAASEARGARAGPAFGQVEPGARMTGVEARRAPAAAEATQERVVGEVRHLVADLERLAGDLIALGPAASTAGPDGAAGQVRGMLEAAQALAASLEGQRDRVVDAQLARLGISAASRGLKLHIGSGETPLAGWINIDAGPADLRMDLRWGLPFADRSAELVFMAHVLEHFYYPDEALAVLKDVRRVLAPGGRLRVVVPDIEQCLRAYAEGDDAFFAARRETWSWWPAGQTRLESFLAYAGAGAGPADFLDSHKYGYDFDTLRRLLRRAGFRSVERSAFMASAEPALRIDAASRVAAARHGDRYYSLFVDAVR